MSFKGVNISLVKTDEELKKAKSSWSWLDSMINSFLESGEKYRNVYGVEKLSLKDAEILRMGLRGRLNSKEFKDKNLKLVSQKTSDGKHLKMQIQNLAIK